jgi:pilus assembly protein FimV
MKLSSTRNLLKTLVLVSLTPSSAYSLGIGEIKLRSALNQNLNAEIPLIMSKGDNPADIKVNLAPPDKFDNAGVPWTSFLSKIKFETITGANNKVIIKISSREVVKEPFLDFILQVNWPKGSLYREFTVLLDPPAAYQPSLIPENYDAEPVNIAQYKPAIQEQQNKTKKRIITGTDYGPTTTKDTLWEIAQKASSKADISVEQALIAIYKENPEAFYKENIHALSPGKILKIPTRESIRNIPRKEALDEFNRQVEAWKNRLQQEPVVSTTTDKIDTPDNQLKLVAPIETDVTKNVIVAPENKQAAEIKNIDVPKAIDNESPSPLPPAEAMEDKIVALEKQLAMMQHLLALKDQQLATLQNQSRPQVKPTLPAEPKPKPVQPLATPPIVQPIPEDSSSDTPFVWMGVFGVILAVLGGYWWRKRKLEELAYREEFFNPLDMNNDQNHEKDTEIVVKNPFSLGASFGNFLVTDEEQAEIDPVVEADLFISYGRFQQAETLMRDAIKDHPQTDEYKLKLLKILSLAKNNLAFEAYIDDLINEGKQDDNDFWLNVIQIKNEFSKDFAIFTAHNSIVSPIETNFYNKTELTLVEYEEHKEEKIPDEDTESEVNTFNLSSFGDTFNNYEAEKTTLPKEKVPDIDSSFISDTENDEETINILDFNLDSLIEEYNEGSKPIASKGADINADKSLESFEYELDFLTKKPEKTESHEPFDLETNTISDKQPASDQPQSLNNVSTINLFQRNFYSNEPASINNEKQDNYFDLTDMETKLELVKAYIAMNDSEGAKATGHEILENGTAEQKKIAEALLKELT